jgi:anion-transporting  ArsA/GET3 family ATPase
VSAPTRVYVVCGSGGVGKTTTSAALAVRLAHGGARTLVLTIDPARRLADALGIGELGNEARPVAGLRPARSGALDAMMLDAKQTFDGLVGRHAASTEARDRILRNRIYTFVSTRLPGVHEYMAMEKLHELAATGRWDAIVLDTPPSAHALDFLAAPARMANLMDEGVMRWLVLPTTRGGWRMLERGSELLAGVLKSMLGERTIGDIAEFFSAFQGLWEGFRERSNAVRDLLAAPTTRFLLVTTPEPGARAEALDVLRVLRERGLPFAGFLVNRCAVAPADGPPTFGTPAAPDTMDPGALTALEAALGAILARERARVVRETAAITALMDAAREDGRAVKVWRILERAEPPHDVPGIEDLAAELPDAGAIG